MLSTPIVDAGFLLDFPIRILSGFKMIYSEIFVWLMATGVNIYALAINPSVYDYNVVLTLFKYILVHPFPFWIIILISLAGTFLSVYFGDELIDVAKHHQRKAHKKHHMKHKLIWLIFAVGIIIVTYYILLTELGINLL